MNTLEIQHLLDSDSEIQYFQPQVLALNQFQSNKVINKNAIFVCNNQPSTKPGAHWFLLFKKNKEMLFIDSLGRTLEFYGVMEKVNKMVKKITLIEYPLQHPFSSYCGEYCIYFAYHLSRNIPLKDILQRFTKNRETNDIKVKQFIKKNFGYENKRKMI